MLPSGRTTSSPLTRTVRLADAMKKSALIFLLGLFAGTAAFAGFFYLGTAAHRQILRTPQPELAWLKSEFHLTDSEFTNIVRMHEAYLPECARRCARIARQDQQLQQLLAVNSAVTPEIQSLLHERAQTRAECEAEMLKHFLAVSQTMPPEQGRRYLAWVESQSSLNGKGMEATHASGEHHHH